jgi:hypothetical protein
MRDISGQVAATTFTGSLVGNASTASSASSVPVGTITSSMILDNTILDADINASAAIAKTKLASGTASRVEVTDASGFLTESTVTTTELSLLSGVAAPIVTTTGTQTLSNKTITGASIVTPAKLEFKQDTFSNLTTYALTATNGQACWASDVKTAYIVKDATLASMSARPLEFRVEGDIENPNLAPTGAPTYNSVVLVMTAATLIIDMGQIGTFNVQVASYDPNGANKVIHITQTVVLASAGASVINLSLTNATVPAGKVVKLLTQYVSGLSTANITIVTA